MAGWALVQVFSSFDGLMPAPYVESLRVLQARTSSGLRGHLLRVRSSKSLATAQHLVRDRLRVADAVKAIGTAVNVGKGATAKGSVSGEVDVCPI